VYSLIISPCVLKSEAKSWARWSTGTAWMIAVIPDWSWTVLLRLKTNPVITCIHLLYWGSRKTETKQGILFLWTWQLDEHQETSKISFKNCGVRGFFCVGWPFMVLQVVWVDGSLSSKGTEISPLLASTYSLKQIPSEFCYE